MRYTEYEYVNMEEHTSDYQKPVGNYLKLFFLEICFYCFIVIVFLMCKWYKARVEECDDTLPVYMEFDSQDMYQSPPSYDYVINVKTSV